MSRKDRISQAQLWLRYATEDLAGAVRGLTHEGSPPRHVCSYAQQAAEKALKAALLLDGKRPPFIYDLDKLVKLLPDAWPVRRVGTDLAPLTQWAVKGLYPGDWREAMELDAEQAVAWAQEIHDAVKTEFGRRLGDAGPSAQSWG